MKCTDRIVKILLTLTMFASFGICVIGLGSVLQYPHIKLHLTECLIVIVMLIMASLFYAIMFLRMWRELWSEDSSK